MPQNKDGDGRSGFLAFWTSLPGVLTGVAAVIGAVATLGALFFDNDGTGSRVPGASAPSNTNAGSGAGGGSCFRRYFAGVPSDRIASVEAGTEDLDVIAANQPKAGTVGLRLTNNGQSIGAMRLAFFPANELFKVESVVDERCETVEGYENASRGGDKHLLQNSDTVRLRLGGAFYDLRLIGSSTIRLHFTPVVP
ncbi:MAG: hypothetical protein LC808_13430 [Actinobacteria bacterium]|nr:hypothetical protein [Actinomycetota bacterium]